MLHALTIRSIGASSAVSVDGKTVRARVLAQPALPAHSSQSKACTPATIVRVESIKPRTAPRAVCCARTCVLRANIMLLRLLHSLIQANANATLVSKGVTLRHRHQSARYAHQGSFSQRSSRFRAMPVHLANTANILGLRGANIAQKLRRALKVPLHVQIMKRCTFLSSKG